MRCRSTPVTLAAYQTSGRGSAEVRQESSSGGSAGVCIWPLTLETGRQRFCCSTNLQDLDVETLRHWKKPADFPAQHRDLARSLVPRPNRQRKSLSYEDDGKVKLLFEGKLTPSSKRIASAWRSSGQPHRVRYKNLPDQQASTLATRSHGGLVSVPRFPFLLLHHFVNRLQPGG